MTFIIPEPAAREVKPDFLNVPNDLRAGLENIADTAFSSITTAYGGVSASASFIAQGRDGRAFFIKGSHPQEMSHGAENLRQEIAAYRTIAVLKTLSPQLRGSVHTEDDSGWHLAIWDYIAPAPLPKTPAPFLQKLCAIGVADIALPDANNTRAALRAATAHSFLKNFFKRDGFWAAVPAKPDRLQKIAMAFASHDDARVWFEKNIPRLAAAQNSIAPAQLKTGLMHGDLRCDNFLQAQKNRIRNSSSSQKDTAQDFEAQTDHDGLYVVDWPNAAQGPLLFDALTLCAHMSASGYGSCESLVLEWARLAHHDIHHADITPLAAAMAGYYADQVWRDVPSAMPRLRWMQKLMLFGLLSLLAEWEIIDSPPLFDGQHSR